MQRLDVDLTALRARIANLTLLPVENIETLYALKYEPGQFFRGHLDAHPLDNRRTTSRVATFLAYLNDVPEDYGGETYFPLAVPLTSPGADFVRWARREGSSAPTPSLLESSRQCSNMSRKDPSSQSACERDSYIDGYDLLNASAMQPREETRGLFIKPKRGAAVVWWSRRPDGQIDPASQHTGCTLQAGVKFAIVGWIHYAPIDGAGLPVHAIEVPGRGTVSNLRDFTHCETAVARGSSCHRGWTNWGSNRSLW